MAAWQKKISCNGIVLFNPEHRTTASLVICTDWRWLDIGDLTNLFLCKIDRVGDFYVYGYRWTFREKRHAAWEDLKEKVTSICGTVFRFPQIVPHTTVKCSSRGLSILLPNIPFLEISHSIDLPDCITREN